MGTGKKKIEIKKIQKESARMVTFSKRRKGLFKKAQQLRSMTGSNIAIVVFSPMGKPYTFGDPDTINAVFEECLNRCQNNVKGAGTATGFNGASCSQSCDNNNTSSGFGFESASYSEKLIY